MILDYIIPPAVAAVFFAAVHAPRALRRAKSGEKTRIRVYDAVTGVLLFAYTAAMLMLLLTPLRSGPFPAAQLRPVPFSTLLPMIKDCISNGLFDKAALEAWTGAPQELFGAVLSHSARNLGANLLLFMPGGALLVLHARNIGKAKLAAVSLCAPLFVELWQYFFTAGRTCDIDDVMLNFIGIFAGGMAVRAILRAAEKRRAAEG